MTVPTQKRPVEHPDPEALMAEARAHARRRRRRRAWAATAVLALAIGAGGVVARDGGGGTSPAGERPVGAAPASRPAALVAPSAIGTPPAAVLRVSGDRVVAAGVGWFGAYTGSGVLVDGRGVTRPTPAVLDGQISDAVADGRGGVYVGGDFRRVGEVRRPFLARLQADGTLDPAFRPRVPAFVDALALVGGRLIAGGDRGVAAYDPRSGRRLQRFPGAPRPVREVAVARGVLYVGGEGPAFAGRGAAPASVVAYRLATGRRVRGFRVTLPAPGSVRGISALRVAGGRLLIGVRRLGPGPALLRVDPRTGRGGAVGGVRGQVEELRPLGPGRLLAAGAVAATGAGETRLGVVLDPRTGAVDPAFRCPATGAAGPTRAGLGRTVAGVPGRVTATTPTRAAYDAALSGGRLWLAGRGGLGATSGETLDGLLLAVDPRTCAPAGAAPVAPNGPVNALAPVGTGDDAGLLAGGHGWVARPRPARDALFDGRSGQALGPARGLPPATRALLPAGGGRVWAASYGELRLADPVTGRVVRRIPLTVRRGARGPRSCRAPARGAPVCDPVPACPAGVIPDGCVPGPTTPFTAAREGRTTTGVQLARAGGRIFVLRSGFRGAFTTPRVEAFDAATGTPVPFALPYPATTADPQAVTDILGLGDGLYLAGSFRRSRPDGTPANLAVVRVDARTGRADEAFDPHVDGPVQSLATDGRRLFLDGNFARPATGLLAVDPRTGAADRGWRAAFPLPGRTARVLNDSHLERVGGTLVVHSRPGVPLDRGGVALDTRTGARAPLPAAVPQLTSATTAAAGRWFVAGQQPRPNRVGGPGRLTVAGVVPGP